MTMADKAESPSKLKMMLPILSWLPHYNRAWLRGDFLAGVTIMALLVPEGMAYAELAGVPPETAFYAAPIGLLLYAVFGSSRQLVVAVSSAIAVMSASIVVGLAPAGSTEFFALTAALAALTGLVAILAGLLRLGRIAQFFSESVLVGFISGLALVIAIKQLPKMFGLEAGHGNFWERFYDLLVHLPEIHWLTFFVGVNSLLLMLFLERRYHRIPAALVAMIYGIVVVSIFGLAGKGVHIIGEIPAGLAPPRLPDVDIQAMFGLIPGALALTLVAFAEAIGPARSFAAKHKYTIDANQELIGLGAANLGAGLFQGFPVGASLSKSAANDAAGAHSQMSGIVAAGLTVLVALFLTPLFFNLPEATLAAIVVIAIAGMVKVRPMQRLYRVKKFDFWLAVIAFLGVVTFDEVLTGLLVAVIVSLLALIYRASQSRLSVLGREPGQLTFVERKHHPEALPTPGMLIVRPDEGLFFANAASLRDAIQRQIDTSEESISIVLLDLAMTNDLDVPSANMLAEFDEALKTQGIHLLLIRVREPVRQILDRSGATTEIGPENFYSSVIDAVLDHLNTIASEEDSERIREGIDRLLEVFSLLEAHADDAAKSTLKEQRLKLEQLAKDFNS